MNTEVQRGYVMRVLAVAGAPQLDRDVSGKWVKSYDVDKYGGRGETMLTERIDQALVFDTFEAATHAWREQSKVKPFRTDGKPNRPLTSYSVSIEPLIVGHADENLS